MQSGAVLGKDEPVAEDILELQRAFDDAELHGDAGRLGALLAEDFGSIGEQGFQLGKQEWIDRHRDFRYLAMETTEVDVRRYDKAAIVRCVQRSRATWCGEPIRSPSGSARYGYSSLTHRGLRPSSSAPSAQAEPPACPAASPRPPGTGHSTQLRVALLERASMRACR